MPPAVNSMHDKDRDDSVPKESDAKAAKELGGRRKASFECDRASNHWTARAWRHGGHNTTPASTDLSSGINQAKGPRSRENQRQQSQPHFWRGASLEDGVCRICRVDVAEPFAARSITGNDGGFAIVAAG